MWFGDGDRWRSECGDRHSSQRTGCRKGGKGERDVAPRQTRTSVPRPGLGLQARSPFRVAATVPYGHTHVRSDRIQIKPGRSRAPAPNQNGNHHHGPRPRSRTSEAWEQYERERDARTHASTGTGGGRAVPCRYHTVRWLWRRSDQVRGRCVGGRGSKWRVVYVSLQLAPQGPAGAR